MYIYSISEKYAKMAFYAMGVLWVSYGYPVVRGGVLVLFRGLRCTDRTDAMGTNAVRIGRIGRMQGKILGFVMRT